MSEKSPEKENGIFQTGGVAAVSACHFIHDVYSAFLSPLLPLLIEKLSMSLTQAGALSTFMQLPALLNPFIGRLADRVNVRWFVVLAPVTTAVPMSLIGLAPSYGVLLMLLIIAGISTAVFHVPAPVMVARLSGPQVGKGMSFFMTGGELSRTVGPIAAVGAVSLFGLDGFYPVMIVGIFASFWLYFKLPDLSVQSDKEGAASLRQTWRSMRYVLLPLIFILTARAFMHASMVTFLPTFLKLETGDLWLAGLGLTVLEAAGVAGVFMSGTLSDRFGRRKVLLVSLTGAPLFMFLFVASSGIFRFIILAFLGLTLLSTTPVMLALVQENAKESPSAANGFFMMSSFLVRSAVVIPVGFIGDALSLKAAYIISACIGLAGLPFIFKLPEKADKGSPKTD